MTSNLGSQYLIDDEIENQQKKALVMDSVRAAFKPEFVNRLDSIVVFDALTEAELSQIVDLNIDRLSERLEQKRLNIGVTPAARAWLAKNGYDPVFGARPLRRLMQQQIDDQLANLILAGNIADGSNVRVDVQGDSLSVEPFEI